MYTEDIKGISYSTKDKVFETNFKVCVSTEKITITDVSTNHTFEIDKIKLIESLDK